MIDNAKTVRQHREDDIDVVITRDVEQKASEELAQRIAVTLVDPVTIDEENRAPGDRSPGYADALMPGKVASIERAADLNELDWGLIVRALEHYAVCKVTETPQSSDSNSEVKERVWPF